MLYTDGLDEMTNHHELYGVERLKKVLASNAGLEVLALKEVILRDVVHFQAHEGQNDDLTLVVAGLHTYEEALVSVAVG